VEYQLYDVIFALGIPDTQEARDLREQLLSEHDQQYYLDNDGCRWSKIYKLCAFTMLGLAAANVLQAIGAFQYESRMFGAMFGCLLGCINFAAIVTTGVFRFNTMGKYAALSTTPSKYDDQPFDYKKRVMITSSLSDDHTYESDANVITFLWIAQMSLFCFNCCAQGGLYYPKKAVETPQYDKLQHH